MRIATRTQSLELDHRAQVEYGMDANGLMENAVCAIERALDRFYPKVAPDRIWIVAGSGKNGEDGRRLGARVGARCFSCAEFLNVVDTSERPTVVVDAMLGIGIRRPPEGEILRAIREINHLRSFGVSVLAVDTPTGLDLDTGNVLGEMAIVADQTVTFGCAKPGFFLNDGPRHVGQLVVDPIGFPVELMTQIARSDRMLAANGFRALCRDFIPCRGPRSNKSHFGQTVVVGGSQGMEGAAVLACRAAFRVGSGYVTWVSSLATDSKLDVIPHVMRADIDDVVRIRKASAVVVGPGLARRDSRAVYRLLENLVDRRVVLDAGALSFISESKLLDRLMDGRFPDDWLLTPHAGEAARLMGWTSQDIERDRRQAAQALRDRYGGVVLLKGFHSVIAMAGRTVVVNSGGPTLAKAGTGDVLSGMIGGFAAQAGSMRAAALLGCYLHGAVADQWVREGFAVASLEATDLIEMTPKVFSRLSESGSDQ